MGLEDIYRPVREELAVVEELLRERSQSENKAISDAVCEILSAGGKRLRPALLLIAAKACSHTGQRAIKLATAIELIHTASLVHDDVLDHANVRRGRPTINSRWGNKVSVLAGDHLYSKAVGILAEDGDPAVMHSVSVAVCEMTDSETTQAFCRGDVNMTETKYLAIISGKTASLISCSCRIGATAGGAASGQADILGDYGRGLGMAFQITDDLLDVSGGKERLGKPLGNDILQGSLTLPFIHAMDVADDKDREWMADAFRSGQIDDGTLARMRNMVVKYGGVEYSLAMAKEYGRVCKEGLKSLEESTSRTSLAMLTDSVVRRAR